MSLQKKYNESSATNPLAKLPEMQLFPSDEARDKAMRELNRGFYTWSIVPVLIVHIVLIGGLTYALIQVFERAMPAFRHAGLFAVIAVQIGYVAYIRYALRRDMKRDLRQKLRESGVAVCLDCGYDLRGTVNVADRCPECGSACHDLPTTDTPSETAEDAHERRPGV